MAKSDCVTCGRTLYFSHPSLEEKGLFSPAWGAYLERRHGKIGMRCLRCIGTENCVSCGQTLGEIGSVAGDKDGERSCFCGTEFCVDCVKREFSKSHKNRDETVINANSAIPTLEILLRADGWSSENDQRFPNYRTFSKSFLNSFGVTVLLDTQDHNLNHTSLSVPSRTIT